MANKNEIRVHVVDYGRDCFYMRYRDLVTRKQVARSTEVPKDSRNARKEAGKAAGAWEKELREGRYKPPSRTTWAEFRQRYEDEVLPSLAAKTAAKVYATFNAMEEHVGPVMLSSVTAEAISKLQSKLREASKTEEGTTEPGRAESTIKGHMAHLHATLAWAKRLKMIHEIPEIQMPHRSKKSGKTTPMKGRPITGEEFDRMLAKVRDVVCSDDPEFQDETPMDAEDAERAESWKHTLRGLWLSGLRLGEALDLWWDRDDKIMVDLTGRRPMMRIRAELEKGHQDRLLPIAPEFAEFLLSTPEAERTGPVFNPRAQRKRGERLGIGRVGKAISEIGEKAGVKVLTDRVGRVKFASAHDLRRSFGDRWAARVMPQILMELMRHESIETTLRYYVGRNADATSDVLYQAMGNSLGNFAPSTLSDDAQKETASNVQDATCGKRRR